MLTEESCQYPVIIRVGATVPWKQKLKVRSQDGNETYRLFVKTRDGKWHKQHDPVPSFLRGRAHVACQFGDEFVEPGTSYAVVALTSMLSLPNEFPETFFSIMNKWEIFQVSPVYEVLRV